MATESRQDAERRRGVDIQSTGIHASPTVSDVGIAEARRRFGGIDVPASLVGMLTALSLVVLLSGLVSAAVGTVGYQVGLDGNEEELSIASLVGGIVILFVAYLVGGWTAGRIARYDGPRNGLLTAIWTVALAAVLAALAAALGDEYDVFRNVDLPQFFSEDTLAIGAIVSGLAALAAMLLGGWIGGGRGERWHRRADATLVHARPGGMGVPTRYDGGDA